jgi:hypothetical protein
LLFSFFFVGISKIERDNNNECFMSFELYVLSKEGDHKQDNAKARQDRTGQDRTGQGTRHDKARHDKAKQAKIR